MGWSDFIKIAAVGLIQGVEVACNNKSLEYLRLSERTMMNSSTILFVTVIAWCWGLERLNFVKVISVTFLTLGSILQGLGQMQVAEEDADRRRLLLLVGPRRLYNDDVASFSDVHALGVAIQLLSILLSAQRWSLVQFITQQSPGTGMAEMSKLQLTAKIMPATGSVCLVLAAIFESQALTAEHVLQLSLLMNVVAIALGIAVLTVSEIWLVDLTSAVCMQVFAILHQIPLFLVGLMMYQENVDWLSVCGFAICLLGALCYAWSRSTGTQGDGNTNCDNKLGRLESAEEYELDSLVEPVVYGHDENAGTVPSQTHSRFSCSPSAHQRPS